MIDKTAKRKPSDRHHQENLCDACNQPAPYFVTDGMDIHRSCMACLDYVHFFYFSESKSPITSGFAVLNPGICMVQADEWSEEKNQEEGSEAWFSDTTFEKRFA